MNPYLHAPAPVRWEENPHGAEVRSDGTVRFRLWAPGVDHVKVELTGPATLQSMTPRGEGWHELISAQARPGAQYFFVLPNGMRVPDPASKYQPMDVHGPSEVVDPSAWRWNDSGWSSRPWEEAVLYELHTGTFTAEGTFRAAIDKLDHLGRLGVTGIELMPIGEFPGQRNWGYDGVMPYAPDATYGRPEDLKALVEAAHAHGLMVLLDVVYNHFGPEGNYLPLYAPGFFTDRHKTPWGPALNFDGLDSRPVREFVIQNAIYWVKYFHMDGLRLDAVHAILDDSRKHILAELAERVRAEAEGRPIHLILENEENEARWLTRDRSGRAAYYTAQWNDDVHHVLHTAVTREETGYYMEYCGDTKKLGRAIAEGFAFQGEMMSYRGSCRGEASRHLPPSAFVAFLQNHDQVGNRAYGDRLAETVTPERLRAAAAVQLLLPQTPMLFMGEEWNSDQPFPFFCDFGPELAEAVRKGRRDEFSRFPEFRDPARREGIPDPQAEATFASAKLNWDELNAREHQEWLKWYRRILAQRRAAVLPLIPEIECGGEFKTIGAAAVVVRWRCRPTGRLVLAANLSGAPVEGFPAAGPQLIWQEGSLGAQGALNPWTVLWWIESDPGSGE